MMSMMLISMFLSVGLAASNCSSGYYCGTTAVLDRSVGPSGSVDQSAYYFYNNSYPPYTYVTSSSSACPIVYYINGNSLTITGSVAAISGPDAGFNISYQLSATNGNNPLLELQSNQYVANGGTIDPTTFSYFSLTQGTLTGFGIYAGVSLSMSELMHPLMIGTGANGKNLQYGSSGWFSFTNNSQIYHTDLNVDITCRCDDAATCSSYGTCSADGSSCVCNTGYTGTNCNQCASGYSGYPTCVVTCNAATTCSSYGICAADGSCVCNTGYTGTNCNQCASGYSGYPTCVATCDAATTCSSHGLCAADGSCVCYTGYTGTNCNQCASGYSGYPNCTTTSGGIIVTPTSTPVNGGNAAAAITIGSIVAVLLLVVAL